MKWDCEKKRIEKIFATARHNLRQEGKIAHNLLFSCFTPTHEINLHHRRGLLHAFSDTFIPIRDWCDTTYMRRLWHENMLRTAIEAQLLGCRTVVVEGRTGFTRNNVLKLWKFLIEVVPMLHIPPLWPSWWGRTWSSWAWRNSTESSAPGISTTSASKHFRYINIKCASQWPWTGHNYTLFWINHASDNMKVFFEQC